jgi:histidinol-phosphate/aromatic aminotransferase/cobyric acid decarboxylase-like protein
LGPPESAIAAIQSNLNHLTAYPDPNYSSLRAAISQFHSISPDWILPGNGAAELLTWACRDLAALKTVILPTPTFSDYPRALISFNAQIQPVLCFPPSPLLPFPAAPPSQTGLLLNNPHNPTGHLFSKDFILPLLEQFALVVVDEAFMDFLTPTHQQSVLDWVQTFPNLVVIRSLTKFYSLPGLRLGYAIAHPERLRRWQAWRDPWPVNTLAAAVGEVVLQDVAFQQRTWNWLKQTRPILIEQLAAITGLIPNSSAANFLLVKSEQPVSWLQRELLKRHCVLIRDCLSFPELGDRYFRVAIRTLEDNQQLIHGLQDVLEPKT